MREFQKISALRFEVRHAMRTTRFYLMTFGRFAFVVLAALAVIYLVPPRGIEDSIPAAAYGQDVSASDWYMAGANPQRTSRVSEEVRGNLQPLWARPFEPYISQKIQVVAANNVLFISTASGLYALAADTGDLKWVYPTEIPLGHSPTVVRGVVYVGGFDRKIHAIDALTGKGLWSFEASKGFHTNPLVVEGILYAGNRDGRLYAIDTATGRLLWTYRTDGPILFSAAYDSGVVYFASNDSHAYALDAKTGKLVWKSAALPGAGFRSWWPVVYRDVVILAGSGNYKNIGANSAYSLLPLDVGDIYPNNLTDPRGTPVGPTGNEPGDWAAGTLTIDTSKGTATANGSTKAITEYFEQKPWRRSYFVLSRSTGQEVTYDFNRNGKPEYAPILWTGTHSGNRYPPLVGGDGVLYQQNSYMSAPYIPGGHVSGWKIGTPYISVPLRNASGWAWNAVDEPMAYSAGGMLIYYSNCCDRDGGWVDLTKPGAPERSGYGSYYGYDVGIGASLAEKIPGYNKYYYGSEADEYTSPWSTFGKAGSYGWHADGNPPIPHRGRLFMIRSNAVIALGNATAPPRLLPDAPVVWTTLPAAVPAREDIRSELESEVRKVVEAGHLRPGYVPHGLFDQLWWYGDFLTEYWSNSSQTILALVRALPFLSEQLKQSTGTYLQKEMADYPPHVFEHNGWKGAAREAFEIPPDVNLAALVPSRYGAYRLWEHHPFVFYALWKYAETFGHAKELFDASRSSLPNSPENSALLSMPHAHNALIAGYIGYLKLEALAGYPESSAIRAEYERLVTLRTTTFSKDFMLGDLATRRYGRTLNSASNFLYLVPELATLLRERALTRVTEAVAQSSYLTPYWFVANPEEAMGENAISPLYDMYALFQARALILKQPFEQLARFVDIPAVKVGDLYYIQNLVSLLESSQSPSVPASPKGLRVTPQP